MLKWFIWPLAALMTCAIFIIKNTVENILGHRSAGEMTAKPPAPLAAPGSRAQRGTYASALGIACNLFLFAAKLAAGLLSKSVSILADAVNNLSDAGSALVTLAGFRLAKVPGDSLHPFGHGRVEYVSGLLVSCFTLALGVQAVEKAGERLTQPQTIQSSPLILAILALSVLLKLSMAWWARRFAARLSSPALRAMAVDSAADAFSTAAVLAGAWLGYTWGILLDGQMGLVVAAFIFYSGLSGIFENLSLLLGETPDPGLVESLERTACAVPGVLAVQKLMVHDYGPGHWIVSFHIQAAVFGEQGILLTQALQKLLYDSYGCEATIQLDPPPLPCPAAAALLTDGAGGAL